MSIPRSTTNASGRDYNTDKVLFAKLPWLNVLVNHIQISRAE